MNMDIGYEDLSLFSGDLLADFTASNFTEFDVVKNGLADDPGPLPETGVFGLLVPGQNALEPTAQDPLSSWIDSDIDLMNFLLPNNDTLVDSIDFSLEAFEKSSPLDPVSDVVEENLLEMLVSALVDSSSDSFTDNLAPVLAEPTVSDITAVIPEKTVVDSTSTMVEPTTVSLPSTLSLEDVGYLLSSPSSLPQSPLSSDVDSSSPSPSPISYRKPYARSSGYESSSPASRSLDKKARKKQQNKDAATRYRQKKKLENEVVSQETEALEKRNTNLKNKVESMEREIAYLKELMAEVHKAKTRKR